MSVSGKNMERVVAAKEHHNMTCSLGPAVEVHMHPFDVERCGWEDGDKIAGLTVITNGDVQPDRLRILCTGEGAGSVEEAVVVDAVSSERELIHV